MPTTGIKHPEITVQLIGGDGNAFAVIGKCCKALRKAGLGDECPAFTDEATAGDYVHLLGVAMAWFDVQ